LNLRADRPLCRSVTFSCSFVLYSSSYDNLKIAALYKPSTRSITTCCELVYLQFKNKKRFENNYILFYLKRKKDLNYFESVAQNSDAKVKVVKLCDMVISVYLFQSSHWSVSSTENIKFVSVTKPNHNTSVQSIELIALVASPSFISLHCVFLYWEIKIVLICLAPCSQQPITCSKPFSQICSVIVENSQSI